MQTKNNNLKLDRVGADMNGGCGYWLYGDTEPYVINNNINDIYKIFCRYLPKIFNPSVPTRTSDV